MEWIAAVVLRPIGSLILFGFALYLSRALHGFIPAGVIRRALYDRSIQKRHPWKFAILAMVSVWGTIALIALYYHFSGSAPR